MVVFYVSSKTERKSLDILENVGFNITSKNIIEYLEKHHCLNFKISTTFVTIIDYQMYYIFDDFPG